MKERDAVTVASGIGCVLSAIVTGVFVLLLGLILEATGFKGSVAVNATVGCALTTFLAVGTIFMRIFTKIIKRKFPPTEADEKADNERKIVVGILILITLGTIVWMVAYALGY